MLLILGGVVLVGLIAGARLLGTYVSWLWFGEVGYRQVFHTMLLTRAVLWTVVTLLVGGILALNLWIAYRSRPVFLPFSGPDDPLARYRTLITERAKLFGWGIPLVVGVIAGLAGQVNWQTLQLYLNSTPFGIADPQFGYDISFYTFELPLYRWVLSWLFVVVTVAFLGCLITHYIFGGIRLAGRRGRMSTAARVQLAVLAGIFVLLKAVDYYFDRFDLLLSRRNDLFTGATNTDLHAVMPAKLILLFIALFCAGAFFAAIFLKNLQIPALAAVLLVLSSVLIGSVWPALREQFSVRPNANEREAPSIERNMAATRQAFGITPDKVEVHDYPGRVDVPPQEVARDQATVSNARLLDPNILSETFTQLTQQYNFYGFNQKLDVDRYPDEQGNPQDHLVAVREINTSGLAANQQSWINRHMVYTHGNGFVTAPADRVDSTYEEGASKGGYPVFSISDVQNQGRGRVPVSQPRTYYGELVSDYAIVGGEPGSAPREYDTDQAAYTYTGRGGVPIGNWFNRLVFSAFYGERNILFNQAIGEQSRIIFERNPRDRVQQVAPWLKVDGDPYPAVVNGRIKWIIDGYTTLNNYPYSELTSLGETTRDSLTGVERQPDQQINYIRNSVKATVDAYDGSVDLYGVDDRDPVLNAWKGVFPGVVKSNAEVPPELRAHFRYPEDLFKVQRSLLAQYHVSNPFDFYSTQTFWEVPQDPTVGAGRTGTQQPPYYVVAQVPGQNHPTFQITSALTALRRPNMAAWISGSSDPQSYGKLTVLRLPTQNQTLGPVQVQRQMETTPKVTENRTLFANPAVQPLFGNLLTLPVAGGLLYVEPIYIQPNNENALPQLAKVLVVFGGRVGFHETLNGALEQVFGAGATSGAPQPGPGGPAGPPSGPPSGSSPELSQAVNGIRSALERVRAAQQSGNLAELGSAFQQLDAAVRRFEQLQQTGG